jgi:adenosylcobinamide-GDP ribazoletransferase
MAAALLHELRLFFIALQFFTRVPIPSWVGFEPAWLQQCARHFPGVGAVIGAVGAGALALGALCWPPAVAVGVAMAVGVVLTGGFHEDGLADTFDALGGWVSRERALTIMKDSRIGSYGALALVLVLGLRAATLTALVTLDLRTAVIAWVWVQCASRLAPVWLTHRLPYAGDAEHAKAKPLAMQVSGSGAVAASGWLVLACGAAVWALPAGGQGGLGAALLAGALATLALQRWLRARLGGFTGDTLGASQQLSELAMLLAWLGALHGA